MSYPNGNRKSPVELREAEARRNRVIPVPVEKEIRCPDCNRLLMKGELAPGSRIQVKCPRVGCEMILNIAHM